MAKRHKQVRLGNQWGALLRTIRDLKLPWFWIIVSLVINLVESEMLLKIATTTGKLLDGAPTGKELSEAILLYVLTGAVELAASVAMHHSRTYSVYCTRRTVWRKMLGMRMEYFDRNDPSEQMSTVTNDSNAALDLVGIVQGLPAAVYYVVRALTTVGGYHHMLVWGCLALLPIKWLYAFLIGRLFQKNNIRLYNRIGTLTGYLSDRIAHLSLVKTHTNEQEEELNGEKACNELLKANMHLTHQSNISTAILSVIDILQKFVVIVIAVMLLRKKEIDLAMWLSFFLLSQNLFSYLDQVMDYWVRIKGVQGSYCRITEIMQDENEPLGSIKELPEGDIRFCNVTFSYPETQKPALDDVSFTVERGSCVAIVGLCGSGKTTSISLLERLYSLTEGQILIGDTDIRDINLYEYRRRFAYVQQGAGLFGGTLRELLTYGIEREVSDEEIFEAAEKTGLNEYLELCDNCLDTEVASGGVSMSGGQGQRLTLTRELLRGGDIILLDEPTSALDVRVSTKIQDTIDTAFADKTRILVTHDLRFAQRYDKIIVMSDGKLVGEGTHDELLQNCEVYRDMNNSAKEEAAV